MRILHTSDWHLGMPNMELSYLDDQEFFLEQLYAYVVSEKGDAVIIAGDVFDSGVTNSASIDLYDKAMTKLCLELGVKVLIAAGNHDSASRLQNCNALLEKAGLYIRGKLTSDLHPVLLDDGKVAVYLLPFFTKEAVKEYFREDADRINSSSEAAMVVCDHIRENMDRTRRNIVVSHSMIVKSELSDSDRAAKVGNAAAISLEVFKDFDYVALGHIHKPQVMAPHVRYSGTPIEYSFSEAGQNKGMVLIDTDTLEQRVLPLKQYRKHTVLTGTYAEVLTHREAEADYVAIELTDRNITMELRSELRAIFPYLQKLTSTSEEEQISETNSISIEGLSSMSEEEIMLQYMKDYSGVEVTDAMLELFRDALKLSMEEGDLA